MHGLDPETDVSPLVDCMLEQVCVGQHQVQLHLDSLRGIALSIEGDYAVTEPGASPILFSEVAEGAVALVRLLGHVVTDASVAGMGTLRLSFDDGSRVDVHDSNSHYESYQIRFGARWIVV